MPSDQRPPFATYLLPSFSFPFRRRQQSTSSSSSNPSLSSSPASSISTSPSSLPSTLHFVSPPPTILEGPHGLFAPTLHTHFKPLQADRLSHAQPSIIKCSFCATDLAFASQIVSKGFTGRHGRAYLVSPPPPKPPFSQTNKKPKVPTDLVNIKIGRSVNRELLTGAHVVADVSCIICQTVLGWKYVDAKEQGQRYKIGKFILETKRVVVEVIWEDMSGSSKEDRDIENMDAENGDEGAILFDEDDEDECEDLFAGVWDRDVVAKRRGKRVDTRRRGDVQAQTS